MKICCLVSSRAYENASDKRALNRFQRTAEKLGHYFVFLNERSWKRVKQCDALFIRATTSPNDHTFRAARTATSLEMPVIDHPADIRKCANKVFLQELFHTHNIPTPRTKIITNLFLRKEVEDFGFPLVLKVPDGSFSRQVKKANNWKEFVDHAKKMFKRSSVLLMQEFMPTRYDWRVGILNNEIVWVCKYFMAKGHWQIIKHGKHGSKRYGKIIAIDRDLMPKGLRSVALRTAKLVGKGLYGIDIKSKNGRYYVIEVNDNPNIDAGYEDVVNDDMYKRIIRYLAEK